MCAIPYGSSDLRNRVIKSVEKGTHEKGKSTEIHELGNSSY